MAYPNTNPTPTLPSEKQSGGDSSGDTSESVAPPSNKEISWLPYAYDNLPLLIACTLISGIYIMPFTWDLLFNRENDPAKTFHEEAKVFSKTSFAGWFAIFWVGRHLRWAVDSAWEGMGMRPVGDWMWPWGKRRTRSSRNRRSVAPVNP